MNKFYFIALFLFISKLVFAHGEDKLGPNQGYIQMPGAFHTEVVPVNKTEVKVYLLDIEWKNPIVLESEVKASVISKIPNEIFCVAQSDYFLCRFPKSTNLLKKSELHISATRKGQVGTIAKYSLPLQLQKKSSAAPVNHENMDHSGHH